MWEDNKNKNGGRWLINLVKNQRNTELDKYWLETLLCMIGEAFGEYGNQISGATINLRPKGNCRYQIEIELLMTLLACRG